MRCTSCAFVVAEASVTFGRLRGLGPVEETRWQGHSQLLLFSQELPGWCGMPRDAGNLEMDAAMSHRQENVAEVEMHWKIGHNRGYLDSGY